MKRMLKAWALALAVLVGVQAESRPVGPTGAAPSQAGVCRHLSRRGAFGRIAMQAGNDHAFPEGAEISMSRTRSDDVKRKIHQGWSKRKGFGSKRGPAGGSGVSPLQPPSVLASYDISIRHGGKKWQPAAGDPVRVTVELDEPVPVTDISTLGVAHLSDDGTVEELPASRRGFTLNAAKTAVTAFWFKATGFSVYAIVDNGEGNDPGRRLYGFFSLQNDDTTYAPHYFTTQAGNRSYRQIVKSGEMLLEPEALPSPAGLTFMGWFLYDAAKANTEGYDANGYATTPFDFSQPIVFDTLGEEEFALRAVFAHNAHVIFHEQLVDQDWPITAVRRGQLTQNASTGKWEASIPIDDMTVTYDDSKEEEHSNATPKMIFRGWSLVPVTPGSLTNVLGEAIHLESSPLAVTLDTISSTTLGPTHLYPVFVNINWITYKAAETGQGATYIPPKYYYMDEGTNSFPQPVRTGYAFTGWWTGTNTGFQVSTAAGELVTSNLPNTLEAASQEGAWGGYVKNDKLMLAKNVTLYGRWEPALTKYTVVIWQQKVTDAANLDVTNRTYDFVASYTNYAVSATSVAVAQSYKDYDFSGFTYARCDDAKTINGNGSTVLNVYYDRNVHTLTFYKNSDSITITYRYNNSNYTTGVGDLISNESNINTLNGTNAKQIGDYRVSYYGNRTKYYCIELDGSWYAISSRGDRVYSTTSLSVSFPQAITSITALVGASIKDYFPIVGTDGTVYEGYHWSLEKGGNLYVLALDTMVERYTSVWGSYSGTAGTINYYVEVGAQEEYDTTFGNKHYKKYKNLKWSASGRLTYDEEFHEIEGYTRDPSNAEPAFTYDSSAGYYVASVGSGNVNNLYYDRAVYTNEFVDSFGNVPLGVSEVKYLEALADKVPTNLEANHEGYSFTGWYADDACSTRIYFDEEEFAAAVKVTNKVLYANMPAHNLRMFAGWETKWYLIQIDPNGGELAPGQSNWFWEPYNGDPIEEYATTTRSYTEAYDGTWFYAKKDRAFYGLTDEWDPVEDDISDRGVYYTQDQSDPAIVDANKRYTGPVQSVYRYAGWYEVHEDGSEELYAFGQPVQHNTLLRLHWKHIGTYRLVYHAGAGTMSNGDENETETFTLLDSSVYADSSEVLVTRTADAPAGYYFVGWKIRHADDTLYRPGQTFKFNSGYTTSVPGADGTTVRQLVLDAVYEKVTTVSLKFDANGGTVSGGGENAFALDYENAPVAFTNVSGNAITVSGMRNNAYGTVGDGSGFSCSVDGEQLEFLGWNTAPDGTGTHFDPGALIGLDVDGTVDENGVNTLYAEWGVKVYFNINNPDGLWNETAWPENYVWDEEKQMFYQMVVLNGYASDPEVPLTSTDPDDMFYYWGEKRYSDEVTEFDFSQPITTATLTLYAFWSDRIDVAVHAVDTTQGARTDKDEWLTAPSILMNVDTVKSFETDADGCVTVPEGYAFAFACVSDSHANVSEDFAITNLYYDMHEKHVYVTYANGESGPLPDDKEIYFVYYMPSGDLSIGYKLMDLRGNLTDESVTAAAPKTASVGTSDETAYDMAANVTAPRAYAGNRRPYFAYAIGDLNATGSANLHLITTASKADSARPALLVKEVWDGYQYSIDGGENWVGYGYDAKLYVVYFDNHPTIVTLNERTLGTAADMAEQFEYTVVVNEYTVTTTETQPQRRTKSWGNWSAWTNNGNPTYAITTNSSITVSSETSCLANGGNDAFTLLYASTLSDWTDPSGSQSDWWGNEEERNNQRTTTETIQTITITQTPKNGFVTTNDGVGGDQKYVYTYTVTGVDDESDQVVTFTNAREVEPVMLHVALSQSGAVTGRDDLRTTDTALYTLSISNGVDNAWTFGSTAPDGFFTGDASVYRPVGLVYGKVNEDGVVEVGASVTSVAFAQLDGSPYYGLYVNGDSTLTLDDGYGLYYVYCEMPKVYYMKETSNGALTAIDPIKYMGNAVANMGFGTTTIAQGNVVDVDPDNGTVIAGSGRTNYRVPTLLDGARPEPMNRASYAVGTPGLTNTSAMDGVTTGDALQIKVIGGVLKWSADGETWNDFSGSPAVYVIYKEVGYDLTINCPSLASEDDRANDTFTITITSDSLVDGAEYLISGYSSETVTPVNGTITLTVTGGSHVVIQSLPNKGDGYTVQETLPERYDLENLTVNGNQPTAQELTEDGNGVNLIMESDTTVEFTTIKNYDVTFVDENGNEISTGTYHYGTDPSKITTPDDPTKPMDETSIYRFDDWGPTIGPVGSNTTYTAEYREIKIPSATQRAVDTNIVVTLDEPGQQPTPEQLKEREEALTNALAAAGIDVNDPNYSEDEANEILNSEDPNGLTRWENLVTGTDTNEPPLSTSVSTDDDQVTVQMADEPGDQVDLGYTMLRDLRKYIEADKTWVRVAGPAPAGNPAFNIPLVDAQGKSIGATGLYRVYTLLVPDVCQAITNEIPSKNIIGVLEVESSLTNTVVAVPWKELASDPAVAKDITVSNYVSTVNLTNGDSVYALSDASKDKDTVYEMWVLNNGKWDIVTTVSESASGYSVATEAAASDLKRFPRTKAVWVQRQKPLDESGANVPFFLVGQYEYKAVDIDVAGGSKAEPGYTLISVPSYKDFGINELDWSGYSADGTDFINVVNGSRTVLLKWSADQKAWCTEVVKYRSGRPAGVKLEPYTTPLKAGTGFWFCRHSGAFTITWTPSEEVK